MDEGEFIEVYGARVHNLKNVDLRIPRNQLVVITGLSGSGKSSLAFDTIYAEGQRRYIETFSAYARQFLGGLERPDVDKIDGLSPVIAIEQKTVSRSPRSTVGTITEIYDFMRLLFARVGTAYSYASGQKMVKYSDEQIVDLIMEQFNDKKIAVLAPRIKGRKGHYRELFEQLIKSGYTKVRVDGELKDLTKGMKLDRYKIHDIEILVDRIEVKSTVRKRLSDSVASAMKLGNKSLMIYDYESEEVRHYSRFLMCPSTGVSYPEPEPNLFSFNSPYGACHRCAGLGEVAEIDPERIIPNPDLSIRQGGLEPLGEYRRIWVFEIIERLLKENAYSLDTPIRELDEDLIQTLLVGNEGMERTTRDRSVVFEGLITFLLRHAEDGSAAIQRWAQSFMNQRTCPECHGHRLKKEALYFRIGELHIGELASMDIAELHEWFEDVEVNFDGNQLRIAEPILREIRSRLGFVVEVGLTYLTLHRSAKTLSGGEAQRIRLATQIGSELMNVLYVLDEPSIGLHQRDNSRLITSLKRLRDAGNSVLVVEHDKEMIEAADFIVDIGPGAGVHGGRVVNAAPLFELLEQDSLTTQYLKGIRKIEVPSERRSGNGFFLEVIGASGRNLQDVDLRIPLGTFTCVTGVSGSGKSSLINQTLYPILLKELYKGVRNPLPYKSIQGIEYVDKVIEIDQSPIGRTPRSNPATYTKLFDEIRSLFAALPEAQIRGYKPGRFSFNVKGGRCETCSGGGMKLVEMNFLPDVYVACENCNGKRYNRETLEVRYKGKSIGDVLEMTIEAAVDFFEAIPKIHRILKTLQSVGLGYVTLGQSSTTLSGGEAQRIKLSSELAKRSTGKTIYILDEPSTGLHFEDIRMLLEVLQRLVEDGNTVLVIEHNLDIIKVADYIIDIGPDGGKYGGKIVCEGTPESIVEAYTGNSFTAQYLRKELTL